MRLAKIMRAHGLTKRALAAGLGLDPSTVTHWFKDPVGRRPSGATTEAVAGWLEAQGVPRGEAAAWELPAERKCRAGDAAPAGEPRDDIASSDVDPSGDETMLLQRQPLAKGTRAHFRLGIDPFLRDPESRRDVFASPDVDYIREAMWSICNHGGMLAVIGESGSGKSTLLDDLEQRIADESAPLVVIRPDVTGMEATDTKGRLLRVAHIQEAVIHGLDPEATLRQSPEARARQMRNALIAARQAGQRVTIAIDEAHAMPEPSLRHMKRLIEVKDGLTRLLSVILLGQPELGNRLSERNPAYREVVARTEVVRLDPLDDQLERYLEHRLRWAGRELSDLIDQSGLDALRAKLKVAESAPGAARQPSRAYPLLVHNLVAAALNLAAAAGQPRVTAATLGRI